MKSHPVFTHLLTGLIPRLVILGTLSLLLTACVSSSPSQGVDSLVQFFSQRPTATSEIMSFFINFKLAAWEDRNCNGIWKAFEPPLAGIKFRNDGEFTLMFTEYPCVSDEVGTCTMRIFLPGVCTAKPRKTSSQLPPSK